MPTNKQRAVQLPHYLTMNEAAAMVRVKYHSVWDWVRTGRLPATHAGSRVLIDLKDLNKFLEDSHKRRESMRQPKR